MQQRPTEARHPSSAGLHARAGSEVLALLVDAQGAALGAVEAALPMIERAAVAAADVLAAGGRLGYAGAGSSGLMALADCLELPGTFGIDPGRVPMLFAGGVEALIHMQGGVEDDAALAIADLDRAGLVQGDMVLVLSASGTTPYALVVAAEARARGVMVAGFANVPGAPLLMQADIAVLLETGPEVVSGSTRMVAGTAQKVALNLLSTLIGIRLGHVHDGYMVNLTADNAKLIDRAARMVSEIAGVPRAQAEAALAATAGSVKPAVLVARGVSPDATAARLIQTGGHLAPILND